MSDAKPMTPVADAQSSSDADFDDDLLNGGMDIPEPPPLFSEKEFVGKFRIGRKIGSGGMGWVYEAVEIATGRKVALKFFKNEPHMSPSISEAQIQARLNHPNLCTLYGCEQWNHKPVLILEYLDDANGQFLDRKFASDTRPSKNEAIEITTQILNGIEEIHSAGLLHHDLKPANIWVGKNLYATPWATRGSFSSKLELKNKIDGSADTTARQNVEDDASSADGATTTSSEVQNRVKILDFGVAGRNSFQGGTEAYFSPEQRDAARRPSENRGANELSGESVRPKLDVRSDLWAVGAVMYEMRTGNSVAKLQEGMNATTKKTLQLNRGFRSFLPGRPLDNWIEKATAYNREDRFSSASDMRDALKGIKSWPGRIVVHFLLITIIGIIGSCIGGLLWGFLWAKMGGSPEKEPHGWIQVSIWAVLTNLPDMALILLYPLLLKKADVRLFEMHPGRIRALISEAAIFLLGVVAGGWIFYSVPYVNGAGIRGGWDWSSHSFAAKEAILVVVWSAVLAFGANFFLFFWRMCTRSWYEQRYRDSWERQLLFLGIRVLFATIVTSSIVILFINLRQGPEFDAMRGFFAAVMLRVALLWAIAECWTDPFRQFFPDQKRVWIS